MGKSGKIKIRIWGSDVGLYYDQFQSWADEFDRTSLEKKKMIICQLVREINVSKGYELEIVLDVNYDQFFATEDEIRRLA